MSVELQSLSSHSSIVKVEQVRIVFCWLHILHTLPTSTIPVSWSVQWECPLHWLLGWCSISVSINPTTTGTTSVLTPDTFFLTLPSWRTLSPRARQAGCWNGGHAEILCASGSCGLVSGAIVVHSRGRGFDSHPDQRLVSVFVRKKFLILLTNEGS